MITTIKPITEATESHQESIFNLKAISTWSRMLLGVLLLNLAFMVKSDGHPQILKATLFIGVMLVTAEIIVKRKII